MRKRWNKFVDMATSREAVLTYGVIAGGVIIMIISKRPVLMVTISDSMMREILEGK